MILVTLVHENPRFCGQSLFLVALVHENAPFYG